MRLFATGLLVAMAAAFLLLKHYAGTHPGWDFALAFTEAAMVGGLADWFAVTALFRHPLGLPIPHTAIIPDNKDRIADSMAAFLRDNFLTPQVVARRLIGFNLAASAAAFLSDPRREGEARLRDGAASLIADVLESLDPDRIGGQVRAGLARQLEKLEVAPLLGQMLAAAIADKRHLPLIDGSIRWAGHTLEANEDMVRTMIRERANSLLRFTGLDTRIANSVLDGLYKLMAEMIVMPDHPLRLKIESLLEGLAHDLVHDPVLRAKVEGTKREMLANPALTGWWQGLWERFRHALIATLRDPDAELTGKFGTMLADLGQAVRNDPRLQTQINRFARRTLVGVVSRYGDEIVRLVSETVKRWDAGTVTARIEGAVGRDLQFIRINGTLVGGLVGLAIHAVERLL
ncbi:DUF445 domain-containing protein [Novosphingobium album (ex Liu et al. 2023)]|uniref:DUF445 domain-containing protein n=1 Tax=Novosphingobium album (ex Liu et al. 2023) TaxID=3031130 RepID=A0ABT5WPE8_9SPHN|nr:DUF445 domain-containing protein [Novosphingobium album (ex Liu et al. 2023)]MDE8651626.1 DUF445 domain-containing protein [Novosphingobium album (ex Liu et al. 2023)]